MSIPTRRPIVDERTGEEIVLDRDAEGVWRIGGVAVAAHELRTLAKHMDDRDLDASAANA